MSVCTSVLELDGPGAKWDSRENGDVESLHKLADETLGSSFVELLLALLRTQDAIVGEDLRLLRSGLVERGGDGEVSQFKKGNCRPTRKIKPTRRPKERSEAEEKDAPRWSIPSQQRRLLLRPK